MVLSRVFNVGVSGCISIACPILVQIVQWCFFSNIIDFKTNEKDTNWETTGMGIADEKISQEDFFSFMNISRFIMGEVFIFFLATYITYRFIRVKQINLKYEMGHDAQLIEIRGACSAIEPAIENFTAKHWELNADGRLEALNSALEDFEINTEHCRHMFVSKLDILAYNLKKNKLDDECEEEMLEAEIQKLIESLQDLKEEFTILNCSFKEKWEENQSTKENVLCEENMLPEIVPLEEQVEPEKESALCERHMLSKKESASPEKHTLLKEKSALSKKHMLPEKESALPEEHMLPEKENASFGRNLLS